MTRGSVFWNVNRTPTLEGSPKYLPWRCGSNRRLRGLILWLCGIPLLERVEQHWFHRQPIALDRRGFKLVLPYTQQLKIEGEEPSQIRTLSMLCERSITGTSIPYWRLKISLNSFASWFD